MLNTPTKAKRRSFLAVIAMTAIAVVGYATTYALDTMSPPQPDTVLAVTLGPGQIGIPDTGPLGYVEFTVTRETGSGTLDSLDDLELIVEPGDKEVYIETAERDSDNGPVTSDMIAKDFGACVGYPNVAKLRLHFAGPLRTFGTKVTLIQRRSIPDGGDITLDSGEFTIVNK